MRRIILSALFALGLAAPAAAADSTCSSIAGDAVLSARTPEVDLYDAPTGKKVNTLKDSDFPKCLAVTQRAPNMMLQVTIGGAAVWIPPHMVNYRLQSKKPAICRNLAMGGNDTKVGSTRALGEDCPPPKGAKP
ncbi:MAG: hypothetical protein JO348_07385 [Alphaproteobacteria bacterium]|nr:hypothetical protein [Alphaproteobacteria bacterium]MBV9419578.1 hypothetical protein [Alphaproteobacteria bacterium]MBV9541517.1 hypothetical protein [Alphaproteobacteria bacterium]MBV9905685.1 hypothetical protein [Alphaproteobacteria bacterium]